MPFTNTYANNILNWAFGKGALSSHSKVYIGLCSNDPEADNGSITELSGGGYERVLISQLNSEYPGLMNSATLRSIVNGRQINWTKATTNWALVNGFFLSTSPTVGEKTNIFFYGGLELTEEQKEAGGLEVVAGAVALFDPNSLKISFPETDEA